MLTSLQNPRIKHIRSLKFKKRREKEKKFVVEGIHLIQEALASKFKIDYIIYSKLAKEGRKIIKEAGRKKVPCFEVTQKIISEITEVETPPGLMAVIREEKFSLEDIVKEPKPLIIFCHEIQDPGNLGTIIRTADAVGASGVILSRDTVDVYNSKALRATMGSLFHLPIIWVDEAKATIKTLKHKDTKVIATDLKAEKDHYDIDYTRGLTLLLGNEAAGLPRDIVNLADEVVKIPIFGQAESLNVAMCAGIILYEAVRQRKVHGTTRI